jgi:hypothetical protein
MALYNCASDLKTRQMIWISTNVAKGRPQLNSHSSVAYARNEMDGFTVAELAGLHTDYVGIDFPTSV